MNGGYRPGSGRKKGVKTGKTIAADKAREYMIARITAEMEPIVSAQIDLARGLREKDAEGHIYLRKPDKEAGQYLLSQAAGKPRETIENIGEVSIKIDI